MEEDQKGQGTEGIEGDKGESLGSSEKGGLLGTADIDKLTKIFDPQIKISDTEGIEGTVKIKICDQEKIFPCDCGSVYFWSPVSVPDDLRCGKCSPPPRTRSLVSRRATLVDGELADGWPELPSLAEELPLLADWGDSESRRSDPKSVRVIDAANVFRIRAVEKLSAMERDHEKAFRYGNLVELVSVKSSLLPESVRLSEPCDRCALDLGLLFDLPNHPNEWKRLDCASCGRTQKFV